MVRAFAQICVAKSCYNTRSSHPQKSFFGFPSDSNLCRIWLQNCQRTDISVDAVLKSNGYYKLCADHFEDKWFTDSTRTLLLRSINPVPTIFVNNVSRLLLNNCQSDEIDLPPRSESDELNFSDCETVINPHELLVKSQRMPLSYQNIQILKKRDYEPETISQLLLNLEPHSELYQIQNMCRFCMNKSLADSEGLNLFAETEQATELRQICETLLPFNIRIWDGLPIKVCQKCETDLHLCNQLMEQFKDADQYLRAIAKYSLYFNVEDESPSETLLETTKEHEISKPIPKKALVMPMKHFNLEDISVIIPEALCETSIVDEEEIRAEVLEASMNIPQTIHFNKNSTPEEQPLEREELHNDSVNEIVNSIPGSPCSDNFENFFSSMSPQEEPLEESIQINQGDKRKINNRRGTTVEFDDEQLENISEEILEMVERTDKDSLTMSYKCLQCCQVHKDYETLVEHILKNHEIPKRQWICKICSEVYFSHKSLALHVKQSHSTNITCEHCNKTYSSKTDYIRHIKQEQPFKCPMCERTCYSQARLDRHIEAKHNHQLDCKTCGKVFKSVLARRAHERTHLNKPLHMCWMCGRLLKTKIGLKKHMELQHNEESVQCEICDKQFNSKLVLNDHMRIHGDQSQLHQCQFCSKLFTRASKLKKHLMCHSDVRNHGCPHCGRRFKYKQNLDHHESRRLEQGVCPPRRVRKNVTSAGISIKNTRKEPTFPCEICGRKFVKASSMTRHVKFHFCNGDHEKIQKLLDEPEIYECSICHKVLYSKFSYQSHFNRGHRGDTKPFKCDFCNYSASSKNLMILHERNYTGEKPFKCKMCDKVFRTKRTLKVHETTHSEEKPHQCTVCDKSFKSRHRLLEHTFVHEDASDIRPYSCAICQRQFTSQTTLHLHTIKVHTEQRAQLVSNQIQTAGTQKKYQCRECGMLFRTQDYRQRHMRRIHRGAKNIRTESVVQPPVAAESATEYDEAAEASSQLQYQEPGAEMYIMEDDGTCVVQYVTIVHDDQAMNMPVLEME